MKVFIYSLAFFASIFIVKPEAQAQIGAGASILYAFGNQDFAARAHGEYTITDLFSGRLDATYLFNGIEDLSEIHFKIGPRINHHFTNFFSVHGEVGFVFALVNRSVEAQSLTQTVSGVSLGAGGHYSVTEQVDVDVEFFNVFGGPDQLFGSAGFTFWFK